MRTFAQQTQQTPRSDAYGLARPPAQNAPTAKAEFLNVNPDSKVAGGFGQDLSGVPASAAERLTLSRPGDYFEREADSAAETVMRAPLTAHGETRGDGDAVSEVSPRAESEARRAAGGGVPLSQPLRAFFEPRFGQDFSRVRVHTGGAAESASQSLSAAAFTYGSEIFFNAGQFRPDARAGLGLLAHELAHVTQKQSGRVSRRLIQRATIPYGQISWSDFQNQTRPPEAGPAGSNVGAVIQTKFDQIPSYSGTSSVKPTTRKCGSGRSADVEVEASVAPDATDFAKPEAAMVQENSWAQPRFNTPVANFCSGKPRQCLTDEPKERARLLKHEQGHFDITNVMAKNMRDSQKLQADSTPIRETRCGDQAARDAAWAQYRPKVQDVLNQLARDWVALRQTAQTDYDTQTGRGSVQAKQTAWETAIKNGLPTYYPPNAPKPAAPTATPPANTPPAQTPSVQPQTTTPSGSNNPTNPRRTQQEPPAR